MNSKNQISKLNQQLSQQLTQFFEWFQQTKPFNIFLYIVFSFFCGSFIFAGFQFIERNYAYGYQLNIINKLHGIIHSSLWLSAYGLAFGVIIASILLLCLNLMNGFYKYLDKKNMPILITLSIPAIISALISTIEIIYFYFIASNSYFTRYFLLNNLISSIILPYWLITLLIPCICYLLITSLKSTNRKFKIIITVSGIIGAIILYIVTFIASSHNINPYNEMIYIFSHSAIALFIILLSINIVIYLIILAALTSLTAQTVIFKWIKISLCVIFLMISTGLYLFTSNYLFGQSFYVKPVGEIHYYCLLSSLIFFNLSFLIFMDILKINRYILNLKESYIATLLPASVFIIILAIINFGYPGNNALLAFYDRALLIQKHFSKNLISFSPNINTTKHFTPALRHFKNIKTLKSTNDEVRHNPDIFIISIDALRSDYISSKNNSPAINNFIGDSNYFINNYSSATHTSASLSSINLSKSFGEVCDALLPNLTYILRQNGYNTLAFVGTNLGNPKLVMNTTYINDKKFRSPILNGYNKAYYVNKTNDSTDDKVLNQAIKEITKLNNPNKPIFVWLHIYNVHQTPVSTVYKDIIGSKHFKQEYLHRIKLADKVFERYITFLKRKKLYNKSLIILFADHGEEIKEHGSFFHTFSLYNELINVPLAIKLPDKTKGRIIKKPVSTLDITPTILDYLNIDYHPYGFDGETLLPIINKGDNRTNSPMSAIYISYFYNKKSAKDIPGAVLMHKEPLKYFVKELYKISTVDKNNEWKLIFNIDPEYYELYNLKDDPKELNNLADCNIKIVEALKSQIQRQLTNRKL